MTDITKDMVERAQLDAEVKARQARDLEIDFATQQCPLKLGQTIVCKGYSHNGKKMIIEKILPTKTKHDGDWSVHGRALKSDGSIGVNTAVTTHTQYESGRYD